MSAYLPCTLVAVSTTTSGCAPLMGETGVGVPTFRVEPSGAASTPVSGAGEGETGVGDCLEHATATARTVAHVQSRTRFWNIKTSLRPVELPTGKGRRQRILQVRRKCYQERQLWWSP